MHSLFRFNIIALSLFILSSETQAADFHAVGWLNTFLPGGGALLMGEPWRALAEASIETASFGIGYSLSKRSTFTIDGVPEDYPAVSTNHLLTKTPQRICKFSNKLQKIVCYNSSVTVSSSALSMTPLDITPANNAAFLQEVGIKYHMMNVYNSYRDAAKKSGGDMGQGIDPSSTLDLLLSPFKLETVSSAWVWAPLLVVAGTTILDYSSQIQAGVPTLQRLKPFSNDYIAFNQMVLYPVGSGAPEEMFYRGFIQNEAYH